MVSFLSHSLHLRLAFLLFVLCRLVLLHTLIHIALDFAQNITHRAKLSLERLCIHFRILSGKSGKVKTSGIHAITGAYHIGNAEGFEIGSITALVVLKVIDRRRHFFCHTHEQHFLGKPLLDKNGLLRAVIIGRQFKLTDRNTGYRACINQMLIAKLIANTVFKLNCTHN